jgi:hypothetical protein
LHGMWPKVIGEGKACRQGASDCGANLNGMRCIRRRQAAIAAFLAGTGALAGGGGCASPGPPRPPSLHLPAVVNNLTVARVGDAVELRFSGPVHSTDGLPLHEMTVQATLCREVGRNPCEPVPELPVRTAIPAGPDAGEVMWRDELPTSLHSGPPQPIAYRVELFNGAGKTAGYSQAVYTLAGAPPPVVRGLKASGSRLGVVLQWDTEPSSAGEILLKREDLGAAQAQPSPAASIGAHEPAKQHNSHKLQENPAHNMGASEATIWMAAGTRAEPLAEASRTLDATAVRDTPYRYTAIRRQMVKDGDLTLEMRSVPSAPAEITLRAIYPPAAPIGLTAASFVTQSAPGTQISGGGAFAVDLVWQPVEDGDLAGYNVYRQLLGADSKPTGALERLNASPVQQSSFHDASAVAAGRYRYSVTAVDTEGNESGAVSMVLEPNGQP